jgi:hypothetical protein
MNVGQWIHVDHISPSVSYDHNFHMRFEIFMAVKSCTVVFQVMTQCSLVDGYK